MVCARIWLEDRLHLTAANAQDRAQVAKLAQAIQAAASLNAQVDFVDQGYTLEVIKHYEVKRGFVLLPRR